MCLRVYLDSDPLLLPKDRNGPRGLIGINLNVSAGDLEYRHDNLLLIGKALPAQIRQPVSNRVYRAGVKEC
jgi:hypothetical protein